MSLDINKPARFKEIMEEGDDKLIFKILELNGDRCLVECINSGMTINPTFTYLTDDLENF